VPSSNACAFSAYVAFISLWALVVYSPIAHWVWGGGWLAQWGALDFAGGTVVHVNAAVAAVVAVLVVGKRSDYPSSSMLPHNVPFVLLGSGLLWFGWFGFNAGSALAASPIAGLAFVTTMLAPRGHAGRLDHSRRHALRQADRGRRGHGHRGRPRGDHAGGGFHQPDERHPAGRLRGHPKLHRVADRARTSLDDSLDVLAAHGVGGTVGALLTGVFAEKALNTVGDGLLYGNPKQVLIQGAAVLAAIVYSGIGSFVLLKLVGLVLPLRASAADESDGLDVTQHGEEAYIHGEGLTSAFPVAATGAAPSMVQTPVTAR
jgi:Amt family ammonium transporter